MTETQSSTCAVVRDGDAYNGKQGLSYFHGISAESVGATRLCMHLVVIPPGVVARPHLHEDHETAIYVLEGEAEMWYGEEMLEHLVCRKGDFLFIPAGMPHQPYNRTDRPAVAVVSRTDPNEQESVVLLD